MEEIWKDIPEYDGLYQVSNFGRVRSLKFGKIKILKLGSDGYGYVCCSLCKLGKERTYKIHQLVAYAFLNHTPSKHKLVIDHINDVKNDNRVENLQIVTSRFNACKTQIKYSSKFKGVCWDKSRNKWISYIQINKIKKHLGRYENEYDAHLAYQNALKNLEQ